MAQEGISKDGYARALNGSAMTRSQSCCNGCSPGCSCEPPCEVAHPQPPLPPLTNRDRECRILPISTPATVFPIEVVSEGPPHLCCCGNDPATMRYKSFRQSIVYLYRLEPPYLLRWIYEITEEYDPVARVVNIKYESWDWGYYSGGPMNYSVSFDSYPEPNGPCLHSDFRGFCPRIVVGGCGAVQAGYVGVEGEGYSSCTVKTADYKYRTIMCAFPGLEPIEVHYKERSFLDPGTSGVCQPHSTCGSACCLPGGRCRDDLSAEACAALGGIHKPNQMCFGANCDDNTNKGACCSYAKGTCVMSLPHECLAGNYFLGLGVQCEPENPCYPPRGRCCIPNGLGGFNCAELTTESQCLALGGQWGGYQSNCEGSPCLPGQGGACCKADGSCVQVSSIQECQALNGFFTLGGDCGAVQCTGSCCTPDPLGGPPNCTVVTPQQCVAGGGSFVGTLGCNPNPCEQGGACCCQTSHGWDCQQTTQSACGSGCNFFAGQECTPTLCTGGITEAPLLPPSVFASAFLPPAYAGKTTNRFVTRSPGCQTCGAGRGGNDGLLI